MSGLGSCRQGAARILLLEGSGGAGATGEQPPASSAAPGKDPSGRHRAAPGCSLSELRSVRAQPAPCLSFPIFAVLAHSRLGVPWASTVLVSPRLPWGQCPAHGRGGRLGHEVPEGSP